MIEKIKIDIQTSDALPLLALCLNELYQKHGKTDKHLTLNNYLYLGKEEQNPLNTIIQRIADDAIKYFTDEEKKILKQAFIPYMISINNQNEYIKKEALWDVIPRESHKILEELVKSRLLIKHNKDGKETIEIAHEALIRNWDLLLSWLEEEKDFLVSKPHLETSLQEWQQADEINKDKALLNGLRLQRASVWIDKNNSYLTEEEKEFIQKSIDNSEKQEKKFEDLYNKAQEEVIKSKHNIGLALLEKSKYSLKVLDIRKANLFALNALENLNNTLDETEAIMDSKEIIFNNMSINVVLDIDVGTEVEDIIFSHNGEECISYTVDGLIKLWNIQNGELLKTFKVTQDYSGCLAFSPFGTKIAYGSGEGNIKIWDSKSGELLNSFTANKEKVGSISFSPDGTKIIAGSYDDSIKIWDSQSGELLNTFIGHKDRINSISFSPEGTKIISGSHDGSIKIWDSQSGELLNTFIGHKDGINSISFSPDGTKIIGGSMDGSIKIWDSQSGELLNTFIGHKDGIHSISFSPDGTKIIAGSHDGSAKIWDSKSCELLNMLIEDRFIFMKSFFSPDGRIIISASWDGHIRIWDNLSSKFFNYVEISKVDDTFNTELNKVGFSEDGKSIIAKAQDNSIFVWDTQSAKLIHIFTENESKDIRSPQIRSSKFEIEYAEEEDLVCTWDRKSNKLFNMLVRHNNFNERIAFSPDCSRIIFGQGNGNIEIWDGEGEKLLKTLTGHENSVNDVGFSPDGTKIISCSSVDSIKIWDSQSGELLNTFIGHKDGINSISFSPDGTKIISGSYYGSIEIWDSQSGELLNSFTANKKGVESISFSPDGTKIISGLSGGSIKIWDSQSGELLNTFIGHKDGINSISFSPDGTKIISGSSGGSIKIWNIEELYKLNNISYIKDKIIFYEQQLQLKIEGVMPVDFNIPFEKPLWSKNHPFYWLDKVEKGDAEAMFKLGLIYDRDNENNKALEWYRKSESAGSADAKERIVFLEKWMKINELKSVEVENKIQDHIE